MADIRAAAMVFSVANQNLPLGGGGTDMLTSPALATPLRNHRAFIFGWMQMDNGPTTDGVVSRIRRIRNGVTVDVSEANAATRKVVAGGIEPFLIHASEALENTDAPEYLFNISLGNEAATFLQGGLLVLIL